MTGKYALIIGNTEYEDPRLAQLKAPGRDAEDFARVLQAKELCAFDDVKVLLNQTENLVREAIYEFFVERTPNDLLLLYFSGHGVRDEQGTLYLAVRNTNRSRLRVTAIKSDFIHEAMEQSRSKRQVLILDCCNSGAFAQGTKAAAGGSVGTATAFGGGYGRIILTASDSIQYAFEGDQVIGDTDNSLFTHYLVAGLEGEAEVDGNGYITVDALYDYAYDKVKEATPNQTPSKFSSKQEGEIPLRQISRIEDIRSVPLPEALVQLLENSLASSRLAAVQELKKLLEGRNLGLRRSARDVLEQIEAEDDSRTVQRIAHDVLEPLRQQEAHLAAERLEAERLAREEAERQAEEARLAAEKLKAERQARKEAARLARQKAEEERLAAERLEAERVTRAEAEQQAEETRLAAERLEAERIARVEAERQAEEARLATERLEAERITRAEAERQAEEARLATERLEAERITRAEAERQAEEARLAAERLEAERIARVAAAGREAVHQAGQQAGPKTGERHPVQEKARKRNMLIAVGSLTTLCVIAVALGASAVARSVNRANAAILVAARETSTAEIEAQQTSIAREVSAASSATAMVKATGTAIARSTNAAIVRSTGTAIAVATGQSRESFVDSNEAVKKGVFGPESGDLAHDASDNFVKISYAGVDLKNFIAEVTFTNPYPLSKGDWDYGFLFRDAGGNDQYRLVVFSSKLWKLTNHLGEDNTFIAEGQVPDLNVNENGSNRVWILCRNDRGLLYVNGVFIAELDLSARMNTGDIRIGTGMISGHEITGFSTGYQDFIVWSIP